MPYLYATHAPKLYLRQHYFSKAGFSERRSSPDSPIPGVPAKQKAILSGDITNDPILLPLHLEHVGTPGATCTTKNDGWSHLFFATNS